MTASYGLYFINNSLFPLPALSSSWQLTASWVFSFILSVLLLWIQFLCCSLNNSSKVQIKWVYSFSQISGEFSMVPWKYLLRLPRLVSAWYLFLHNPSLRTRKNGFFSLPVQRHFVLKICSVFIHSHKKREISEMYSHNMQELLPAIFTNFFRLTALKPPNVSQSLRHPWLQSYLCSLHTFSLLPTWFIILNSLNFALLTFNNPRVILSKPGWAFLLHIG